MLLALFSVCIFFVELVSQHLYVNRIKAQTKWSLIGHGHQYGNATHRTLIIYNALNSLTTSIAPIWVKRSSCRHVWLLTGGQAHIHIQHTHTHKHTHTHTSTHTRTNTHTHSQNAPILLHNPNLSESTLCFPLGFPPLLSSPLGSSLSLCSCFSSSTSHFSSLLLDSTHLLLRSSSNPLVFFFSNLCRHRWTKPSWNELPTQSQCNSL